MKYLILLLLLPLFSLCAQTPWVFRTNIERSHAFVESVDGGILMLCYDEKSGGAYKIIKVNDAGEILWKHTLADENNLFLGWDITEDPRTGDIFVSGTVIKNTYYHDAFLLKLDACGGFIWFRNLDVLDEDGVIPIIYMDDNSLMLIHRVYESPQYFYLSRFDLSGHEIWSRQYDSFDYADPNQVIKCKDGGFLITGDAKRPPYFDQSTPGWTRAFILKTDDEGELEWFNILDWEQDSEDFIYKKIGYSSVELEDGSFLTASIGLNEYRPIELNKIDQDGNSLWQKYLVSDTLEFDAPKLINFGDDNIFLGTGHRRKDEFNYGGFRYLELFKLNADGEILDSYVDSTAHFQNVDLEISDGNKLLIRTQSQKHEGKRRLYVGKIDPTKMEQDTFLTTDNNLYDPYCLNGITNHTVNLPDSTFIKVVPENVTIGSNPVHNLLDIHIHDLSGVTFRLIDLNGRILIKDKFEEGQWDVSLDVSTFVSGLYLLELFSNSERIYSEKLIIK